MDSHGLSPFGLRFDGLPITGMSNINFLTAGVIKPSKKVCGSKAMYIKWLLLFDMSHLIITDPFLFTFSCPFTNQND